MDYWTLVQHSAWLINQDPQFKQATEVNHITAAEAKKVTAAGGLVFDDYSKVSDAEMAENYPDDGYGGLIPSCNGRFGPLTVDGRPVYIPDVSVEQRAIDGLLKVIDEVTA